MKRKPVPLLKIGIFVLAGFILLVVFIFLLGSKEKLFSSTSTLKARFTNVNSLKKGAQVQMAGINVGSVTDIALPRNAKDSVTVTMKILTDALKLIHTDSRAVISSEGLIGDKNIVITMGSDSTMAVAPGSTLVGEPTKDFTKIFDTLNTAVAAVTETVTKISETADEATQLVHDLRQGNGTVARLVNDPRLYENANALAAEAQSTVVQARQAIDKISNDFHGAAGQLSSITDRINRGEGSLGKLLTRDDVYENVRKTSDNLVLSSYDLHDALAKIALGSGRFAEVTEAFKHNFLIKSYFEDRGYWDAPDYEMTIDRKIDSLNRLNGLLEQRLQSVRGSRVSQ